MDNARRMTTLCGLALAVMVTGCAAPRVDFSTLERPPRVAEMDAYGIFVGSWTWEAQMLNADDPGEEWKGTATWNWTLDERCLEGKMSVHSAHADFNTAGFWSWNPKSKKYVWWMFNNWGHPQEGTAKYDPDGKTWIMSYRSVGLDGNRSYGRYRMTVVDNDTLDWRMDEWADALHLVKKAEMVGTYKRSR